MKLILFICFFSALTHAAVSDEQLRQSIREELIREEKNCKDCVKMRPDVFEREVNRIFASEKNKVLKEQKSEKE